MRKIKYLDGLRGLAALQVVFHHFVLAFYPALFSGTDIPTHLPNGVEVFASGSFLNLFWDGNFAVCIFFVLSGFVLSHKFFVKKENEIVTASAVKRYFRLALPVAFSVFFAYVFMKFSLLYNLPAGEISGSGWFASLWDFKPDFLDSLNQGFIGAFFYGIFDYNKLLWTIACEFLGSFLVFSFLAIFGKSKSRHLAYIFLIVAFFQTYYLAFILGVLLSDLMANEKKMLEKFDKKKIWRTTLLLVGLAFASFPIGRDPKGTMYAFANFSWLGTEPPVFYHIVGAFFLMVVLLESKRLQKFFANKLFLFLGKISFTMYLLHFTIMGSLSSYIFLKLLPIVSYHGAVAWSFLTSLPVIFLVSYAAYIFVDKKAVSFSHFVYEKLFKRY
ncbi:MAG: acyltransferase [Candidatus Moraniibacteriota bacterium]